jgi:hypothetical protein
MPCQGGEVRITSRRTNPSARLDRVEPRDRTSELRWLLPCPSTQFHAPRSNDPNRSNSRNCFRSHASTRATVVSLAHWFGVSAPTSSCRDLSMTDEGECGLPADATTVRRRLLCRMPASIASCFHHSDVRCSLLASRLENWSG